MSYERVRKNLMKSFNWESKLKSANDVFYQGEEKFSLAVKEYGKILEILLRLLYKETIMVIPQKKKSEIFQVEQKIGKGESPTEKFGFGHLIGLFSKSSLFKTVKKLSGTDGLDPKRLNEINGFRIDQTHYDEGIVRNKVDQIRRYTTDVLLKLQLITKDPDEPIEIRKERMKQELEREEKRERMEKLRRILDRIRLGLVGKTSIDQNYEIIPDPFGSKSYHIQVEAEIVGIYLGSDETVTTLVRADWHASDDDVIEEAYEKLISEIRETIEKTEPEIKQNLKILVFDETYGSDLEKAAYACWNSEEGTYFQ